MPCNCGKGKKKVAATSSANFRQGSSNIRSSPVGVKPPAAAQRNVTTAGRPIIKRSVRSLPRGVSRLTRSQIVANARR